MLVAMWVVLCPLCPSVGLVRLFSGVPCDAVRCCAGQVRNDRHA